LKHLALWFFLLLPSVGAAQFTAMDSMGLEVDDLVIGGDIFSDFNEDLESAQVLEAERFYRYGRFYSFNIALGLTTFDGNRGRAFEDDHPTYGLSLHYFLDFHRSLGLGFEFSRHHFFVDQVTRGFRDFGEPVGLMETNMLRVFFCYRQYIDTANLGTAITYSNPYFTGRVEYWYNTNKFPDQSLVPDDSGGGLGFGLGFGFDFPIRIRESYINLEFLYHTVNFHDKFDQRFRPTDPGGFGFDDLTGNVWTTMMAYVFNY
jgi:hypothetical protein